MRTLKGNRREKQAKEKKEKKKKKKKEKRKTNFFFPNWKKIIKIYENESWGVMGE